MDEELSDKWGLRHLFGAVWVGKYEQGWQASTGGSSREGFYDSRETAIEAVCQFTDAQLRLLRQVWSPTGENRPATMADLDALSRSLPAPWYWRIGFIRRTLLFLDRVLPEEIKPWVTREF